MKIIATLIEAALVTPLVAVAVMAGIAARGYERGR